MPDDPELESFKTQIDLRMYAASHGYAIDRKESWRGSSVLRHANGDKIVVKRHQDGHYVYFSVRDEHDNGSIIDFLQNRQRGSLGRVRQALRPWVGKASLTALFPELKKTSRNRLEVEKQYRLMQDAPRHPYLENTRGISPAVLGSTRFARRIKIDLRGNAVFPHFDAQGLCGYELKNENFTGFAKGGEKGLWVSRTKETDRRLVLAESAIDALSHAQLFADNRARYASIGGQMNPRQPALVKAAISSMPADSEIVAAMDADPGGHELAGVIHKAVAESGRADLRFRNHFPEGIAPGAKDWNDVLRIGAPSFPTARF